MVLSFEMANNHSSLTKLIPRQPQIASIKYELTSVLGHGQLVRVSGEELCVKTADLGRLACGQSATAGADMIKTNNRISTQNSSSAQQTEVLSRRATTGYRQVLPEPIPPPVQVVPPSVALAPMPTPGSMVQVPLFTMS